MKNSLFRAILMSLASLTALTGCGSGGDDDEEFVGAATAGISLQPSEIDSGDRTRVEVTVGNVHRNGIALKFRYPSGLTYVPDSAFFESDEDEQTIDISPTVNAPSKAGGSTYLVFYLSQELFRPSGEKYEGESGTVSIQLEGRSIVRDGAVEIDADVDDPAEDNSVEFSVENPEFAAEDEASISVRD